MEDTKHIRISDFDYDLPDGRIAKFPLTRRDSSKLLVYRGGRISEDVFSSLPEYIPAGTLMLFNNTKVIQARLHFRKAGVRTPSGRIGKFGENPTLARNRERGRSRSMPL